MLQPFETIWPMVQQVSSGTAGDVCVPNYIVGAAITGYGVLAGAVGLMWRAKQESDRRTAEDLRQTNARLYEYLREAAIRKDKGA